LIGARRIRVAEQVLSPAARSPSRGSARLEDLQRTLFYGRQKQLFQNVDRGLGPAQEGRERRGLTRSVEHRGPRLAKKDQVFPENFEACGAMKTAPGET
jgi:hypothetical protein